MVDLMTTPELQVIQWPTFGHIVRLRTCQGIHFHNHHHSRYPGTDWEKYLLLLVGSATKSRAARAPSMPDQVDYCRSLPGDAMLAVNLIGNLKLHVIWKGCIPSSLLVNSCPPPGALLVRDHFTFQKAGPDRKLHKLLCTT